MSAKKRDAHRAIEPRVYTREEHCISRRDIDPDALKILYRLLQHRYKAFLVGGGVRDLLLHKQPKDFDISTDATPRKIKDIFRNCRIIGRRFKLAHIYFKGHKIIEVSTFRDFTDPNNEEDYAESGANLSVRDNKFGTEETDALRRDITINGLFYDISNFSVIDYVGGMQDLHDGIIRVIGDPDQRFPEDPVRMMRVVRHAVRTGFQIEDRTWASLLSHRELLCEVPPMRVYEELKKDLLSGRSLEMLRTLEKAGLLQLLLPGVSTSSTKALSIKKPLAHALESLDSATITSENPPTITVILAAIVQFAVLQSSTPMPEAQDEVRQLVNEFFADLAVPKKEKERIEHILFDWNRIQHTAIEKIKTSQFARRSHLSDLVSFIEILSPQADSILSVLKAAKQQGPNEDARARRRERAEKHTQNKPRKTA